LLCALTLGLGGCAVGKLSVNAAPSQDNELHQSFLTQAAAISSSAWQEILSSGTHVSAWATILLEGRGDGAPDMLAASSQASPAATYLASKAEQFSAPQDQMNAVVGDLREKTSQVDAFIAYASALSTQYRRQTTTLAPIASAALIEANRQQAIQSDCHVLARAVSELKSQKATYEAVQRRLQNQGNGVDTSPLASAINVFDAKIDRLNDVATDMQASGSGV
jgi:ABC-type transporter Mla subunit MlaD